MDFLLSLTITSNINSTRHARDYFRMNGLERCKQPAQVEARMSIYRALDDAKQIAELLNRRKINNDLRSKLACACFAVGLQHHRAVLLLLANQTPLHASAFALLRPLVESTIRGFWLSHVATDPQVEDYPAKGTTLDMASMMKALDKAIGLKAYHSIYEDKWKALSAYTHTGELQVQRWITTKDVEPKYSDAEIQELVRLSSLTARLASQAVLSVSSAH